jgi:hypothetical protein
VLLKPEKKLYNLHYSDKTVRFPEVNGINSVSNMPIAPFKFCTRFILTWTAVCFILSCSQPDKHNELDSGFFLVSTTLKGTDELVTDSLFVDRYSNDSIYFFDLELFGHLGNGKVAVPNQTKDVPYSEGYQFSGVFNVHSSDSLYGYIAVQSGNKVDTLILQFKRLSNRVSGQKFIKQRNGVGKRILTYRNVDDTSSRFMLIDEALLIVEGNKLTGHLGVHSQGSAEYFLQGTKVDDHFAGKYITLNRKKPTRADSTIGDFKLRIVDDFIELSGDFPFIIENRIKRAAADVDFHYGASSMFYRPSLKSRALLSTSELVEACEKGCEIIGIGPTVNTTEGVNVWYQVNTGGKTGWVLGGLSLMNDTEKH